MRFGRTKSCSHAGGPLSSRTADGRAATMGSGSKGTGNHHVHDPHARQTQSGPRSRLVGSGCLRQTGKSPSSPALRPRIRMPRSLLCSLSSPTTYLVPASHPRPGCGRPAASLRARRRLADRSGLADPELAIVAVSGADSRTRCRFEHRPHGQVAKSRLLHHLGRRMGGQGCWERGFRRANSSVDQDDLATDIRCSDRS